MHDGSVGIVIDPQRDIDRVLAAVDSASLRLTRVLDELRPRNEGVLTTVDNAGRLVE